MEEIKAVFLVSGPDMDVQEIIIGRQGLRVGRGSENNLVLNNREISRQHFRIVWRDDDTYLVEDLNSSNGIWFNDARIPARVAQELHEGDVLRSGPFLFRFVRLQYAASIVVAAPAAALDRPSPLESRPGYVPGLPYDQSSWLQYLPAVYSDSEFMGRFLLIFESIMNPIIWMIDNFDFYLSADTAPQEWLAWMSSWFDLLLLPELPMARQREIVRQLGWLFLRRGTRMGLQRLLELYFDVTPEIVETVPCHFIVRLPLSESKSKLGRELADRLINSQRPAFASYLLEIT
ncbi:MAG: FHA domain-containing protein [Chloroflexota bacterium]|nr:FHA domain-containing protein [Chloroflexota bacterium]